MRVSRLFCLLLSLACYAALAGCSGSAHESASASKSLTFRGTVHGGQQAVSGSTIELYSVGTTGDGSAASTVLQQAVQTDGAGNFNFSSDYTCPASNPEVYLTAVGGNPGGGTNNPQLAMLAALGLCGSLTPDTYIIVNEVTTVGSLAALAPYASSLTAIGSGSNDSNALTSAFTTVAEYTNTATGLAPGPGLPVGYYASTSEINTLADILSTCINSMGGAANDGTSCGRLFGVTKSSTGVYPTDTVQAVLNILDNPTQNVGSIYNLEPSTGAPFQPTLQSAPSDWTLPILPVPAAPTFSEPAGTYVGSQTISLGETTSGAMVYYTLDGSAPTTASTVYTGPINVSSPETITAFASVDGRTSSSVVSADYLVAPGGTPPAETSTTPNSSGYPIGVAVLGNDAFVTVQGTGQIYTYDITTGYPLQVGKPYTAPCNDPSGIVITTINNVNVMAVACYDTGSLVTLSVATDGTLSALGSVGGITLPYPGISLIGTDVYVPLFGKSQQINGGVAKISIATPSAPVVTATVQLASPQPGQYENPPSLTAGNGYLYLAAGSESAPLDGTNGSSTIQVVNASTMQLVGTPFVVPHSPQQVKVSGNTLYATLLDNQILESINISDPTNLQEVEELSLSPNNCSPLSAQLGSNIAFVGCYYTGQILKIDTTQPSSMSITSSLSNITSPQSMAVSGKYLLVVGSNQGGALYQIDTTQAF